MINWEEIDNIEREIPKPEPFERRKIQPSVEKRILDFDKKIRDDSATEEDFHQDNEEVKNIPQLLYLQKALAQTFRWQSFCGTNT